MKKIDYSRDNSEYKYKYVFNWLYNYANANAEFFKSMPETIKLILTPKEVKFSKTSQFATSDVIIGHICTRFKVREEDLKSVCRKREFVIPRQICMFFIDLYTTLTLKEIGALFSNRDHSTVIYAKECVRDLCFVDKKYKQVIDEINEDIINIIKNNVN